MERIESVTVGDEAGGMIICSAWLKSISWRSIVAVTWQTPSPYRFAHLTLICSGWFICMVSLGCESFIASKNLCFPCISVSPFSKAGAIVQVRKIVAITLTNSTWDIFCPGQARGPPDQGRKVPFGIVFRLESFRVKPSESHREGLNERASSPHILGSWCRAVILRSTCEFAGTVYVLSPQVSICGVSISRERWTNAGNNRRISYWDELAMESNILFHSYHQG